MMEDSSELAQLLKSRLPDTLNKENIIKILNENGFQTVELFCELTESDLVSLNISPLATRKILQKLIKEQGVVANEQKAFKTKELFVQYARPALMIFIVFLVGALVLAGLYFNYVLFRAYLAALLSAFIIANALHPFKTQLVNSCKKVLFNLCFMINIA